MAVVLASAQLARCAIYRASAEEDAERYRNGYPGLEESELPDDTLNIKFYTGQIASYPDGDFVDKVFSPSYA